MTQRDGGWGEGEGGRGPLPASALLGVNRFTGIEAP